MLNAEIAFLLGSDAPANVSDAIRRNGFSVLEGVHDRLVYHPDHWRPVQFKRIQHLLMGFDTLPKFGLLEASVDHPHSHVLLPVSAEAKRRMSTLFGLAPGQTFGTLVEGFTRRDFLKGAWLGLKAAKKAATFGALTAAPLGSAGMVCGEWLGRELIYAATKAVIYDRWNKVKAKLVGSSKLSAGEAKTLDSMLDGTSPETLELYNPFEKFENLPWRDPTFQSEAMGVDDVIEDLTVPENWDDWDSTTGQTSGESPASAESNKLAPPAKRKRSPDADGFDDVESPGSDEDQPWMGEARKPIVVGVPSIRHLRKAWSTNAWNADVDSVLSGIEE